MRSRGRATRPVRPRERSEVSGVSALQRAVIGGPGSMKWYFLAARSLVPLRMDAEHGVERRLRRKLAVEGARGSRADRRAVGGWRWRPRLVRRRRREQPCSGCRRTAATAGEVLPSAAAPGDLCTRRVALGWVKVRRTAPSLMLKSLMVPVCAAESAWSLSGSATRAVTQSVCSSEKMFSSLAASVAPPQADRHRARRVAPRRCRPRRRWASPHAERRRRPLGAAVARDKVEHGAPSLESAALSSGASASAASSLAPSESIGARAGHSSASNADAASLERAARATAAATPLRLHRRRRAAGRRRGDRDTFGAAAMRLSAGGRRWRAQVSPRAGMRRPPRHARGAPRRRRGGGGGGGGGGGRRLAEEGGEREAWPSVSASAIRSCGVGGGGAARWRRPRRPARRAVLELPSRAPPRCAIGLGDDPIGKLAAWSPRSAAPARARARPPTDARATAPTRRARPAALRRSGATTDFPVAGGRGRRGARAGLAAPRAPEERRLSAAAAAEAWASSASRTRRRLRRQVRIRDRADVPQRARPRHA